MSAAAEKIRMSEAEYLEWESRAKEKHEYIDGEIFAMVGASEHHNRVACWQHFLSPAASHPWPFLPGFHVRHETTDC